MVLALIQCINRNHKDEIPQIAYRVIKATQIQHPTNLNTLTDLQRPNLLNENDAFPARLLQFHCIHIFSETMKNNGILFSDRFFSHSQICLEFLFLILIAVCRTLEIFHFCGVWDHLLDIDFCSQLIATMLSV